MKKKELPEVDAIFDSTLPTIKVNCPDCNYPKALVFLVPDEEETKMVAKLMCKNVTGSTVKCGNVWELNDKSLYLGSEVKVKQEEEEEMIDDCK